MITSSRGVIAFVLAALLFAAGYMFAHNALGEYLSAEIREEVLEARKVTGSFPLTYDSTSNILGFLPGPKITYRVSQEDCVIAFFPLPLGPRQELECVSGELRYGP
jgi:hypothetical protein